MRVGILWLATMMMLTSCRTQREVVRNEQVTNSYESHRDTVREVQHVYDSIYIDSREATQTRNDTVYRNQMRVEYRYRVLHDTVRVRSEDVKELRCEDVKELRCEDVKAGWDYVPWYARGLLWIAGILFLVSGIRFVVKKYGSMIL